MKAGLSVESRASAEIPIGVCLPLVISYMRRGAYRGR